MLHRLGTSVWHLLGTFLFTAQYALALHPGPSSPTFGNFTLHGKTFVNKGIVAFGLMPSDLKDSTGDTFGGVGSAIAIQRGTWKKGRDGEFSGVLVVQPDRGFNVETTIDYQARQHYVLFSFSPYEGDKPLSFNDSQKSLRLQYRSTLLYTEPKDKPTTGLDPLSVRPASRINHVQLPDQPVANKTYDRLAVDAEGLVLNPDGTFWISDEYGPYMHQFSRSGTLIRTIQPPKALLPFQSSPKHPILNFTASMDPTTGRVSNQGLEGLTSSPSGDKLFALLQSATVQDGGSSKTTSRYVRLLEYDVSNFARAPRLTGEYVIPLPRKDNGNTLAQSEVHYLSDNQFLTLARDGDGNGGDDANSAYKSIDVFDISKATNIANSKFDDPLHPIAINGTLDHSITPAEYHQFVSLIDDTQLARFGLHNGKPINPALVNSKWESIALAPVQDHRYPDDYFMFCASDNDFLTTNGVAVGKPYNAGQDVDNQVLIFRVTLPTVKRGSVEERLGV